MKQLDELIEGQITEHEEALARLKRARHILGNRVGRPPELLSKAKPLHPIVRGVRLKNKRKRQRRA